MQPLSPAVSRGNDSYNTNSASTSMVTVIKNHLHTWAHATFTSCSYYSSVVSIQRNTVHMITLHNINTPQLLILSLSISSPLAANFPFLIHVCRFMVGQLFKENTLEVLHKTALGLVKARREEGKLTKVSELEDPHLLAYEGFSCRTLGTL